MSTTELLTPILTGGIRNTNFFTGRLLSAEDLKTEQQATRQRCARLGQAAGEGVIRGLTVEPGQETAKQPTVKVSAGLALNRRGYVMCLAGGVEVALQRRGRAASKESGLFAQCAPTADAPAADGPAAYILTICPTAEFRQRAGQVGLADAGVARGCGSRYEVEGVKFRLVHLDVRNSTLAPGDIGKAIRTEIDGFETPGQGRFRNLLAHLCLAAQDTDSLAGDLLGELEGGRARPYGPLDVLRADGRLTDCEVPLAVIFWSDRSLEFVDVWAVRRRVHAPLDAAQGAYPATDRRRAEAEAAMLQFQAHLAELARPSIARSSVARIKAVDHFRYLPAAGVVPIASDASARGFGYPAFFEGLTHRQPVFVQGAGVNAMLDAAAAYPPVDVDQKELIWLYEVDRSSIQPPKAAEAAAAAAPQRYLIFTSGHASFRGDARFDLSRWSHSNYGPIIAGPKRCGE